MTYIEHIRAMDDAQLTYFINFIQPEIELWTLAFDRAEAYHYKGPDVYHGLNGDARSLMHLMYKDYDLDKQRIRDCYNPGHHAP